MLLNMEILLLGMYLKSVVQNQKKLYTVITVLAVMMENGRVKMATIREWPGKWWCMYMMGILNSH